MCVRTKRTWYTWLANEWFNGSTVQWFNGSTVQRFKVPESEFSQVMKQLACCVSFGIALSCVLAAQSLRCDRACLEGLVDQYMDALVAHDPSKLSVARGRRNTENGQRLELGDGLWNTATGKGS